MANSDAKTKISESQNKNLNLKKLLAPKTFICLFLVVTIAASLGSLQPQISRAATTPDLFPSGIGNFDSWTANTGSKVDAVSAADSDDTSFINLAGNCLPPAPCDSNSQSFSFPGAALPSGAVVNSVTLTVLAKVDSGLGEVKLFSESGTSTVASKPGFPSGVNSTYTPFTWVMANNPQTSAAWTVSDVNSWTFNFGVANVSGFSGAKVTQIYLSVDYSVHPASVANPPLATQTCGLDIALVLDNSGSINGNLPQMKVSFNNFVNSLLPGTPTDFSVTHFNDSATSTLHSFSNSASAIVSAINAVPSSGGQTNWQDALAKAQDTFDPRPGAAHPNLIIFASDGQPNRYFDSSHTLQGTGGTVDPNALDAAIDEANIIKTAGTRIVTLGIGSSVIQPNMEAISSADAYYNVSSFGQLTSTLQTIASSMCGGTITVSKKIDADGNLATTNDQTSGSTGFSFNISPSHLGQATDANGQTSAVAVTAGTYSVSETNTPAGYTQLGGKCTSNGANIGTATGTIVSGITVGASDIIACTFYNKAPGGGGNGTSTPFTLTLTKSGNGNGTVGGSVNSGTSTPFCTLSQCDPSKDQSAFVQTYASGTVITLTAVPDSSSNFDGSWSGACSGNNPVCNIIMNANKIVNAHFAANGPGGGGGNNGADLSILKTVDNTNPNPGATITYTLVVKNLGPDMAIAAVATDTLPSMVTFVSATSTVGSYNGATGVWTIGDLINGASATTTIIATVNPGTAGQSVLNIAVVGSQTSDSNPSNNTSQVTSTVPGGGGGGGGCTVNCGGGGTVPPGGGGCVGNCPGTGGGSGNGILPPTGQTSSASTGGSGLQAPQVLGESTELPRTGMPFGEITLVILAAAAILNRKLKLI